MKNKKFILGTVLAALMIGVFSFVTLQFQDSYAMNTAAGEDGFTSLYIKEGTTAAPGERVNVELNADTNKWDYISLFMESTTPSSEDYFEVYLKNIQSNDPNDPAYFILPESGYSYSFNYNGAKIGEKYAIKSIKLGNSETIKTFSANESEDNYFNFGEQKYVLVTEKNNQVTEKEVKLNSFKLKETSAKIYDYIHIDMNYTGNCKWGTLVLKNIDTNYLIYLSINDLEFNPYIYLDEYSWFNDGTYVVEELTLIDENYHGYTFVEEDARSDYREETIFNFNSRIELTRGESKNKVNLKNISLSAETAEINEKINVTIDSTAKLESVLLTFTSTGENKNTLNMYVKSLDENPYVIIPFNASRGDYYLSSVVLKDNEGNMSYYKNGNNHTSSQPLNTYISLRIGKDITNIDRSVAYINNLDFNSRILASLDELEEDAIITVNASGNPYIDKGFFETIRETRKTLIIEYFDSEWVFSGTDIVNPKPIDVSLGYENITSETINNNEIIDNVTKESLILTFANNGDLPGKALIRLKSNKIDDLFAGDALYIYYFNDQSSLDPVAMEVHRDNGYYDFYIDHNSKYVLTKKKLAGNFVTDNNKYLKLNTKTNSSNKTSADNNTLVACGVVIILLVIVIIVLISKNKKDLASKKISKGKKE